MKKIRRELGWEMGKKGNRKWSGNRSNSRMKGSRKESEYFIDGERGRDGDNGSQS